MDNRLQFPESSEIDFNVVGLTGQDHDQYADPGSKPRYDWMRMIILGLLSNQAATELPAEFRSGTLHFDLNDFIYKCSKDGIDFRDIASCIKTIDQSLEDWSAEIDEKRARFVPSATFSGVVYDNSNVINIPRNLQAISRTPNKPYLFKNGLFVDPSLVRFNYGCPVAIELEGNAVLEPDDTFVVFIKQ